jgi:hypothetical protein
MSLVSLQSDIIERRVRDGARVTYEDYTYFAEQDKRLSPKGEELAESAESLGMTREKLISVRQWLQQTIEECRERLAQEMTLVYTLSEPRDRVLNAQYLTKAKAAELAPVVPGDLLDLDAMYGGLLVCGIHIFVSDLALEEGLKRYEPADLLNSLFEERRAA